jgi:1-acyl-sn-glycerol-3-phosphate acyltransferase
MGAIQKIISYPLSIVYWLLFGIILVVFHALQWVTFNTLGYQVHKKIVDIMNFFIVKCFLVAGVRFKINAQSIPSEKVPYIIVSNHQSMFDIPPLIWYLRQLHPKFIAKKELAKGIPGISFNLRHGGSVLIDRGDRQSAMATIASMGNYIEQHARSVVIFPEGTRSDGPRPREWKGGGILALLQSAPSAKILPVTIKGSWRILKNSGWPVPFGNKVELIIHEPMVRGELKTSEFIKQIKATVEQPLELAINN